MSAGIDGKWQAMNEDRERLREENANLAGLVERLQSQVRELEGASPSGMTAALEERDVLRARVLELQQESSRALLAADEEEQAAFDLLLAFMEFMRKWGLRANGQELTAAVHVLQGFVLQHMLQRISGEAEQWGKWFDPEKAEEEAERGAE